MTGAAGQWVDIGNVHEVVYIVEYVPEPTTATLALAALCLVTRRRP